MVPFADILLNNTSLLSPGSGPVCVLLVGCSSGMDDDDGIGRATLRAVLRHTSCPTVYLVGEGVERLDALIASVQSINQSAKLIPIAAGDLTQVSSAQDAAQAIFAADPPRLDLLIMSSMSGGQGDPSLSTIASPDLSSAEDLDRATRVPYLARMQILVTLLPLLRRARSPRVVSVLGGGRGDNVAQQQQPGKTYRPVYTTLATTTLFFEQLARRPGNDKMVFLCVDPGVVAVPGTSTTDPVNDDEEVGERVLFAATNGRFRRVQDPERAVGTLIQQGSDGVLGSGVYLVNRDSSVVEGGAYERDDVDNARQRVWEYTMGELERIERM